MMEPPPVRIMCGMAYFITRKGPVRLVSSTCCQRFTSVSTTVSGNAHSGIIDYYVQLAAEGGRSLHHAPHVFQLADVRGADRDLAVRKALCELLQLFAAASRDADPGALANKRLSNGGADASAASCDQCNFTLQSHASLLYESASGAFMPVNVRNIHRRKPGWTQTVSVYEDGSLCK